MIKKYRLHIIGFIFLAVLALFLNEYRRGTTLGTRDTAFAISDYNKVSEIIITGAEGKVRLQRENRGWILNDRYKARTQAVDMMLQTMGRLRVSSPAPQTVQEQFREKLLSESVRIDLQVGRRTITYFVYSAGIQSPTYMMMQGASRIFETEVIGFSGHVASLFVSGEGYWRPNMLFNYKLDDISEILVKHANNGDGSFILRQSPDNEFSLYSYPEGNRLEEMCDSLAVRYLANFVYVPYERFADSDEMMLMDSLVNARPDHIIRVTDRNGSAHEVFFHKIITENNNGTDSLQFDLFRLHALMNDKSEMVVVPYHSVDLLLRTGSYFIPDIDALNIFSGIE